MNYRPEYLENPGEKLSMFICGLKGPADILTGARIMETEKKCSIKKKEGSIHCKTHCKSEYNRLQAWF